MKTYFAIQGPQRHARFIYERYKDVDNVVWCTDKPIPQELFDLFINTNVKICSINPPQNRGFQNFHIAGLSATKAIKYAASLGATHCIKMRSELHCPDMQKLLNICHELMSTTDKMCIPVIVGRTIQSRYTDVPRYLKDRHHITISHNTHLIDYCTCGSVDQSLLFWENELELEHPNQAHGEIKLLFEYLRRAGFKLCNEPSYLLDVFGFITPVLQRYDLDLVNTKNKCNLRFVHRASPGDPNDYQPQYYQWILNRHQGYTPFHPDGRPAE